MTANIQKWGNSQGIRLPKHLLETLGWSDSEQLLVTADSGRIIIEKAERTERKNIKELFADHEGDHKPSGIDQGKPEGKEIWFSEVRDKK